MKLTDLGKCFTTLRKVVSTNLIDSDIIMKTQVEKDLSFKNKEHLAPCKNEHIWWIPTAKSRFKRLQNKKKGVK